MLYYGGLIVLSGVTKKVQFCEIWIVLILAQSQTHFQPPESPAAGWGSFGNSRGAVWGLHIRPQRAEWAFHLQRLTLLL